MERAADIAGLRALGEEEKRSLALACLKNRWLSRGIASDQRNADPARAFFFFGSDSLDALLQYFRSGPHGIREGVVFRELAFVQQVDMGDEWLVLKREFDAETGSVFWQPIESYSFDRIMASRARFERAVSALNDVDAAEVSALFECAPSFRQRQARPTSQRIDDPLGGCRASVFG